MLHQNSAKTIICSSTKTEIQVQLILTHSLDVLVGGQVVVVHGLVLLPKQWLDAGQLSVGHSLDTLTLTRHQPNHHGCYGMSLREEGRQYTTE